MIIIHPTRVDVTSNTFSMLVAMVRSCRGAGKKGLENQKLLKTRAILREQQKYFFFTTYGLRSQ